MTEVLTRPNSNQVIKYIKNLPEIYNLGETSLDKLFHETYPKNDDYSEILAKVILLDKIYSTNIYYPFIMSENILNIIDFDTRVRMGDLSLIDEIAHIITPKGSTKRCYSFATKYCNRHNPEYFPIYDSYVDKLLFNLNKLDNFTSIKRDELKQYGIFKETILKFKSFYSLQEFSLKEIDQYLWSYGKETYNQYLK